MAVVKKNSEKNRQKKSADPQILLSAGGPGMDTGRPIIFIFYHGIYSPCSMMQR